MRSRGDRPRELATRGRDRRFPNAELARSLPRLAKGHERQRSSRGALAGGLALLCASPLVASGCGDVVDCIIDGLGPDLIDAFHATPGTIYLGGDAVLSWHVWDHDLCHIEPDVGGLGEDHGGEHVAPTVTTTYLLVCSEGDFSELDEVCGPRSETRRVTITVTLPQS